MKGAGNYILLGWNDIYSLIWECYVCGQGLVLIMKDKLTNNLILICDDCESLWK
jgi:hypothetical protein